MPGSHTALSLHGGSSPKVGLFLCQISISIIAPLLTVMCCHCSPEAAATGGAAAWPDEEPTEQPSPAVEASAPTEAPAATEAETPAEPAEPEEPEKVAPETFVHSCSTYATSPARSFSLQNGLLLLCVQKE